MCLVFLAKEPTCLAIMLSCFPQYSATFSTDRIMVIQSRTKTKYMLPNGNMERKCQTGEGDLLNLKQIKILLSYQLGAYFLDIRSTIQLFLWGRKWWWWQQWHSNNVGILVTSFSFRYSENLLKEDTLTHKHIQHKILKNLKLSASTFSFCIWGNQN